ncbi:MAG TPA: hypothetical protein VN604_10140 [Nitrospirota bacterium]|nr:hypothetical protein [Nitrospirota bacterium]
MSKLIILLSAIVVLVDGAVFQTSILAQSSGWKTYQNEKHGFEIQYPGEWKLQEYTMREGSAVVSVALDPKKTISQETSETMDVPRGLIEISFCEDDCNNSINAAISAQLPDVKIGYGNSVHAKKQERITGENEPNPAYSNKRIITYYMGPVERFGDYIICDIIITYLSDLDDKYLKDFNQILSTVKYAAKFKFTDKNLPKKLPRPFPSGGQVVIKCGDGICDAFEKAHLNLCPKDCEQDAGILQQELERGWYYGSLDQKKPGTPGAWVHDFEGARSACWHKPGVQCRQEKSEEEPRRNSAPTRKCAEKSQMCGGIAGILCCAGLDCKLSGTYPDASGTCEAQTSSSICEPGKEYVNTAVEPVTCKCSEGYELQVIEMSWGPCPQKGMRDCPAAVLKCVSIK